MFINDKIIITRAFASIFDTQNFQSFFDILKFLVITKILKKKEGEV